MLRELNEIGIALSAEKDHDRLLELILVKAMDITNSDGGTLNVCTNEKSLKFYESDSPVHSVSLHQARQPMYKKSVNLNSKYTKYQDFFEKLDKL